MEPDIVQGHLYVGRNLLEECKNANVIVYWKRAVFSYLFFFFLMIRRPRISPLFPYPTLFRSSPSCAPPSPRGPSRSCCRARRRGRRGPRRLRDSSSSARARRSARGARPPGRSRSRRYPIPRSEEHTSELQSPCNLVCRLLLEK